MFRTATATTLLMPSWHWRSPRQRHAGAFPGRDGTSSLQFANRCEMGRFVSLQDGLGSNVENWGHSTTRRGGYSPAVKSHPSFSVRNRGAKLTSLRALVMSGQRAMSGRFFPRAPIDSITRQPVDRTGKMIGPFYKGRQNSGWEIRPTEWCPEITERPDSVWRRSALGRSERHLLSASIAPGASAL